MEFKNILQLFICTTFLFIATYQACQYQRCCNISPCTSQYCLQRTSQTWISTENYFDYRFTKLVLHNQQCMPCPYNCKSCISSSTCETCYDGYYKSDNNECMLCSYKCKQCVITNGIQKCQACLQGTYLDDISSSCKSCPLGAKQCSSSTAIIQCLSGYLKSSNSLFCTKCPENCISCPLSDSTCSTCQDGFYQFGGICYQCNKDNCQKCLGFGSTVYCTKCVDGYVLGANICSSCPTDCRTCSSPTICTQCMTGFYLQSGGCQTISSSVANCYTYSSTNACSTCQSGYYLNSQNGQCFPCSILCQSCYGNHFGLCTQCKQQSNLFNQMCIIDPFPSSQVIRSYYALPSSSNILMNGGLTCEDLMYSGTSFSINLDDLSAYKIVLTIKVFGQSPNQQYTVSLNTNELSYTASSNSYKVCAMSSQLYLSLQQNVTFSQISIQNQLKFTSLTNLYLSQILLTAYKCNSLCIQCSQTLCFTCVNENLYTQDSYCVYVCSSGYYTNEQNKQCVKQCPQETYLSLSTAECLPCISPCFSCLSQQICLSCIENYYLTAQYTCAEQCPYKYYGNQLTQICEKCVGRCLQCISDEECLSCNVGFLEGTDCVDKCSSSTFYEDLQSLACQSCQQPCKQCQYQSTYCLNCIDGYYFHNSTCLTQCPDSYYADNSDLCQQCEYPCQTCSQTSTNCLSCVDKYLLQGNNQTEGSCFTQCPDGYYEDNIDLKCKQCAQGCSICFESSQNCFQCAENYFLFDNKCLLECPQKYYGSNKLCQSCQGLCYSCLNQSYCLKCQSNFLQQGSCVRSSQCQTGTYANIETLQCSPCSDECLTCQYQSTLCTSCSNSSLVLYDYSCISQCPSEYFYENEGLCVECQSPCVTCINQTHCLSCQSGYKYSSTTNLCSSTCSAGTYFNTSIDDCSQCSENCLICENQIFCYLCGDEFYLHVPDPTNSQNQCLIQCPQGYYPNGLSCSSCLFPCITCQTSIDCLSCATGILYQNRCLSGCPDSTYMDSDQCLPCGGNCLTCHTSATQCYSCQDGFYLLDQDCLSECPTGTYAFQTIKQCSQCPLTCETCLNSTYCLSCIQNQTYLTSENLCSEYCPSGFYGQDSSKTCQKCSQKCLTCQNDADNCMTCSQEYLLVKLDLNKSDCVSQCPTGYYEQNSICYSCVYPCQECQNSIQCVTCINGLYYHAPSKGCLLNCPFATYYLQNQQGQKICEQCISPCSTCINQTYCISCQDGLLLNEGKCVSQCPNSYYQDSSGICNRCYGMCETCSGKYYCLTCHSGYAYDGYCYSSCPPGTYADIVTKKCEACKSPCLECISSSSYCKRCQFNLFAYRGICQQTCPKGTYESGEFCQVCSFPCIDCPNQFSCNQCIGGYLLYMKASCIQNVQKCPNDLYKMNSKQCVPITWCPDSYYKDITIKTCSTTCSRQKYIDQQDKQCKDSCEIGEYVGQSMVCSSWISNPPQSLMGFNCLTFIESSVMKIIIIFNETETWLENSQNLYTIINLDLSRRMLMTSELKYRQIGQKQLSLTVTELPNSVQIQLPAHYVKSSLTNYNLQTPSVQIYLPDFIPYTYSQIYTGGLLGQFSEGMSWFIILFTFFFLVVNRVSDVYMLWDTSQFLYLLIFLKIQYPPNINQFLLGMSNTHFLFIPSMFSQIVSSARNISYQPFYAYSYDSNFLRTAGSPILLIIIVIAIFLLLKLFQILITKVDRLAQKMKQYPNAKKKIFKWLLRFRWHHTSDVFFLTYDIIFLFAISQIVQIQNNPDNIGSNAAAVLFLIIYMIFPLFVGYKLYKHYPNIAKGRMVRNLQCFYRGIQKTNKFGVALILIRYFRKILYCILIGIFSAEPMFALPILMFMSVIMALFIFINKPYRKRLSNIITILTEVCLVLFFMLVALIEFIQSGNDTNFIIGWIACGILSVMLFALVFQVFCKTLFFLQPEKKQNQQNQNKEQLGNKLLEDKELRGKFSEQYLRRKAGQFFHHLFPKIRQQIGMNDSDDQLLEGYQDGDSQNSENNDERQRKWGFNDEQSQRKSDQFRHYGGSNSSETGQQTQVVNQKQPPTYLIRCIKQLE